MPEVCFALLKLLGKHCPRYGLSSASHINHVIPLYINCALLAIVLPSMVLLIGKMPKAPLGTPSTNESDAVLDNAEEKK